MAEPSRITAPLQFLPAFELAARHSSFKRAAEALHLTPSAVSQQIRALEAALGLELFRRMTRALQLTAAGEQFASVVSDTLDAYRRGTARMLRQHGRPSLRLSTDPFIAHDLLIPALHALHESRAPIDLRIETSTALADLSADGVDAAVRYGRGPWPGLSATPLCDVIATPVCAPHFVPRDRLHTVKALARYPLICLRDQADPWLSVASALSVDLPSERLVFDSYFAMLRAAEKGLGIAFGLFPVTTAAVLEGRLVTPLATRVRARAKYHFVCRKEDTARAEFETLHDWLRTLFSDLPALPKQRECRIFDEP